MAGTFDFCTTSRVVTEVPPEEPSVMNMNGWPFTPKPKVPYRPSFKVVLHGLKWYLNGPGTALDVTTNPTKNAGRLLNFYKTNRLWDTFTLNHEYLGNIICRFEKPLTLPAGLPESGGLLEAVEVTLIQHNPAWS